MVWDADSRYFKIDCLFYNTLAKIQIQGLIAKKSKPEEFMPKESKPVNEKSSGLPYINESTKPTC